MSHRLFAVMLASLALIAGGCGSGESESPEGETVAPEPTQGEASPVPSEPLAAKPQEETKAPKKAPSATAGLIGSTDSDERAQQIQQKINAERNVGTPATSQGDPFGLLPVPPARVKLPEAEGGGTVLANGDGTTTTTGGGTAGGGTAGGGTGTPGSPGSATVASLPPLPPVTAQVANPVSDIPTLFTPPVISLSGGETVSASSGGGGGGSGSPSLGSDGGGSGSPFPEAQPVASLPPLPPLPVEIGPALPSDEPVAAIPPLDGESVGTLPPLPVDIGPALPPPSVEPPAIAEGIIISGVVQVGNEIQVIVQLPGSSSGRYVKVGDLIADGRVRVKRVEGIQSSSPIVILEEEGVEYARGVGDLPAIAMEEPDRG
ncbi:MAG TPA: hypothetical protein IGS17_04425 [Oscillatoriales cyanobacterium M59_W2019_021]|nr:hypothetical protein [Oscillatoriales cyanobacterium M4454_W2019_049]HIK50162.1 hypothetical protein [Oscillatoriales cyanobacterium M59_W2019_021]